MAKMDSIAGTSSPLPLPFSSSSSPWSSGTQDGEDLQVMKLEATARYNVPTLVVKRKTRDHNLRRFRSSSELERRSTTKSSAVRLLRRRKLQRSQSADTALPSRSRFHSPDRYISQRASPFEAAMPHRTSQSPETLRGLELRMRRCDQAQDPFRSNFVSRLQNGRHRNPIPLRSDLRPPHYLPSFVHRRDAGPSAVNAGLDRNPADDTHVEGRPADETGPAILPQQLHAVDTGFGFWMASTTNAPHHVTSFLKAPSKDDKVTTHGRRLAMAMNIDQARRIIMSSPSRGLLSPSAEARANSVSWRDNAWLRASDPIYRSAKHKPKIRPEKTLPTVPFRVLDAPNLKDDYYCSILAYDRYSSTLAVALTQKVYLWTERHGVRTPPLAGTRATNYVTALSFSSEEGANAILAISRQNGTVTLWSVYEQRPRFEIPHFNPATCVAFKPQRTERVSSSGDKLEKYEHLLIGDDIGKLYYYSVEWPEFVPGTVTLLIKINAHTQNICGIAWSADGQFFATGGNDNKVYLFETREVEYIITPDTPPSSSEANSPSPTRSTYRSKSRSTEQTLYLTPPTSPIRATINEGHLGVERVISPPLARQPVVMLTPERSPGHDQLPRGRSLGRLTGRQTRLAPQVSTESERLSQPIVKNQKAHPVYPGITNMHTQVFRHSAAVKAIAFAPWQPTLLATGGGSNDRQIHIHHAKSGAMLAVISVHAQVTSLIWSTTRREIAATFGYAQPEHPIRIAVFEWPSCRCVISIPWERKPNGEVGRALWAIPYPGGPNDAMLHQAHTEASGFDTWRDLQNGRGGRGRARQGRTRAFPPAGLPSDRVLSSSIPTRVISAQAHNLLPKPLPRGEGEVWASRTQEEGSLIVAGCDQTVKFFEVWAGRSKGSGSGRDRALGSKEGVLGGSRILEGWCRNMLVDEVGNGEEIIR